MSGSGISWAMCKSAPRPRQITAPNQQLQSTEGINSVSITGLYTVIFNLSHTLTVLSDLLIFFERRANEIIDVSVRIRRGTLSCDVLCRHLRDRHVSTSSNWSPAAWQWSCKNPWPQNYAARAGRVASSWLKFLPNADLRWSMTRRFS